MKRNAARGIPVRCESKKRAYSDDTMIPETIHARIKVVLYHLLDLRMGRRNTSYLKLWEGESRFLSVLYDAPLLWRKIGVSTSRAIMTPIIKTLPLSEILQGLLPIQAIIVTIPKCYVRANESSCLKLSKCSSRVPDLVELGSPSLDL